MKRIFLTLRILLLACISCSAKMWVARVTTNVNLRLGPSTSYDVMTTIPQNAYVFYDEADICGDFVQVIFIDEDISGYLSTKYITNYQEVEVDESGQLQLVGSIDEYNPQIQIENDTNVKMTLKMNDISYKFAPHEKQTIEVEPGYVKYTASSPRIIPYVGMDLVESNYIYEWVFYIITQEEYEKIKNE